jgi:hypothetical protein
MALCPQRVVGGAGPAHHPAADQVRQNGEQDHSEWLAANVRNRIERYLPAMKRGEVAAELGRQRVRGFVAGGG